jgi:RHS repeat-associated protein
MTSKQDIYGNVSTYGYDKNGNQTGLGYGWANGYSVAYSYDAKNRLTGVTHGFGSTVLNYYRDDRIKQKTHNNGVVTSYDYDNYGNLSTLSHEQGGTVMHKFDYQYDDNQNRTQETEFNGIDTLVTDFDYDHQDRLTTAIYAGDSQPQNNGTATYGYDDNSNRETETFTTAANVQSKNITYGYDNNDQLTSIVDSVESANTVVDYDTLGNLTKKSKTHNNTTAITDYIYDARNQLKQVQMGGSTIGAFLYDANGLRVHKSETLTDANTQIASTTQQRYHYQGLNVIGSFDENNTSQYRYYHDGNQILARINESAFTGINVENNAVQTYHQDALGSTAVISNRDGSLTARYQYDAFGNVQTETGESESNDFTYTGHERDQASGLIYAKARYYDPQLGLFLSRDPFEGYDNTPLSLHRYLYAYQNPMKYVDPDGRNPIEDFVGDLKSAAVDYAVDLAYDAAATVMNSAIDSVTPDEGSAADYAVQAHVEVANALVIDPAKAAAESIQNVRNGEYTDAAVALGAGLVLHKADRIAQVTGVDKVAGKFVDGVTGLVQEAKTKLGVGVALSSKASNSVILEGTVGKYKDLRKLTKNTNLTPDHQPSVRSLEEGFERQYGRRPDPVEKRALINQGNCMVISRCTHKNSSETFAGRNRSKDESGRRKYERDADDYEQAVDSNMDALEYDLKYQDGISQQNIDDARQKLHDANRDSGVYK